MSLTSSTVHTWTSRFEGGWRVECGCGFKSEKYQSFRNAETKAARHNAKHFRP